MIMCPQLVVMGRKIWRAVCDSSERGLRTRTRRGYGMVMVNRLRVEGGVCSHAKPKPEQNPNTLSSSFMNMYKNKNWGGGC